MEREVIPARSTEDQSLEDRLPRLPLLTVTASRVGRAMALLYLHSKGNEGADPADVANYLDQTIGWRPSEHTLYRHILLRLAAREHPIDSGPLEPVVEVRTHGGVHHKATTYAITSAGLALLESERRELLGPRAPLSTAIVGLQSLVKVVPAAGTAWGLAVNTNLLLRWLVLHALVQIGPSRVPDIATFANGCAGQIGYVPHGGGPAQNWPHEDSIRRAVRDLMDPQTQLWAVVRQGSQLQITNTGAELYARWAPDLNETLRRALNLVETAHAELTPKSNSRRK